MAKKEKQTELKGKLAVFIMFDESKDKAETLVEEIKKALRAYDVFIDYEVD